ncbi:unannotated protein [freshwater metagenome]|uniref:Unannotated protein n=1 Tax=freshwater metagenome TaxID=449393 RepID=A0A6J7KC71_9ZZZZ
MTATVLTGEVVSSSSTLAAVGVDALTDESD